MKIRERVDLSAYNSFRLPVVAEKFVVVNTEQELIEAVKLAKNHSWPVFVLGGGTNLIFMKSRGLVIKNNIKTEQVSGTKMMIGAGNLMSEAVELALKYNLAGLEWAGGLPGTVGGAVRGNAGAFGGEMKDNVDRVWALNPDPITIQEYTNKSCRFGYRDSVFKHNRLIITRIEFKLIEGRSSDIENIVKEKISFRRERHPMEWPSAGSVFKNVPIEDVPHRFLDLFKDSIKTDPFPVVPAAKIIAVAGLKGLRVGEAQISEKHSNFIINLGHATSEDILALIGQVRKIVRSKYHINLEIEQEVVR